MPGVAVIGEAVRVQGFALAGALVLPISTAQQARAAWRRLAAADVAVAVLTPRAAAWLAQAGEHGRAPGVPGKPQRPGPLVVVMPP